MTPEEEKEFFRKLQSISPVLFTIAVLNAKFLKDMQFGEIHIVQHVKNGKIFHVEATPTISKLIE